MNKDKDNKSSRKINEAFQANIQHQKNPTMVDINYEIQSQTKNNRTTNANNQTQSNNSDIHDISGANIQFHGSS